MLKKALLKLRILTLMIKNLLSNVNMAFLRISHTLKPPAMFILCNNKKAGDSKVDRPELRKGTKIFDQKHFPAKSSK